MDHFVFALLFTLTVLLTITFTIGKPPRAPETIVLRPTPIKSLLRLVVLLYGSNLSTALALAIVITVAIVVIDITVSQKGMVPILLKSGCIILSKGFSGILINKSGPTM